MKLVEKFKKPLLLLLFAIVGFIIPQTSYAITGFVINIVAQLPLFFLYLLVDAAVLLVKVAGWILNWVLDSNFITMSYTNPATNPVIATGLGVTQSLVNMILILILIYIALATILRLQEYQAQKLLPIFILIALLVNFTPVICGVIVDASNIIMDFFVRQILGGVTRFANDIEPKINSIGGAWDFNRDWTVTLKFGLQKIILVPFLGLLAFFLLLFGLLFMLRHIAIWILVILSPIAFIAYILPVTRSWWRMWWSQFINWCFIGVFAAFFLYLSLFFITNIQASIPTPTAPNTGTSPQFSAVLPFLVGIVFLGMGLVMGLKTSAMGAGAVIRFTQARGRAAAKLYAREGGGIRTAERLAAKAGKRLGMERPVRAGIDKVSRAASRAGDIGVRIPGTQKRIKPFAPLKWVTPQLRKVGNLRTRVDEATKTHEGESGVSTAQQILTHTIVGAEATGGLIKNLKQNDAQDIFNEARKIKTWRGMSDQEILQSKRFQSIIAPLLKNAQSSGYLGTTVRRDPRLAQIAAAHKIGGYANLSNEMAISKAVNEARTHINDWEPEELNDKDVIRSVLANFEEDRLLQLNRSVKRGQETFHKTGDKDFSDYVRNESSLKDMSEEKLAKILAIKKEVNNKGKTVRIMSDEYKKVWGDYKEKIEKSYGGSTGFGALESSRVQDRGYRTFEFISEKSGTSAAEVMELSKEGKITDAPPAPPPPPKGRKAGGGTKSKGQTKPPRGRKPEGSSDKKIKEEEKDKKSVQIPFMITQKMKKDLKDRGYSKEDIKKMTPQEAQDILNK